MINTHLAGPGPPCGPSYPSRRQDPVSEPIPDPLWWLGTEGKKIKWDQGPALWELLWQVSKGRGKDVPGGGWADGQEARVRKQPPGSRGFTTADPSCSHFSLRVPTCDPNAAAFRTERRALSS